MRIIQQQRSLFILRLFRGEELFGELTRFVKQKRIRGAWFSGLGGATDVEVAYYDLKKRKYFSRRFREPFEILNITGNIAFLVRPRKSQFYHTPKYDSKRGDGVVLHAHGTFSRPNFTAIGGHIMRCVVGGTCEILLQKLPPLQRSYDSKTGLSVLI